jgi:hypothetical protein
MMPLSDTDRRRREHSAVASGWCRVSISDLEREELQLPNSWSYYEPISDSTTHHRVTDEQHTRRGKRPPHDQRPTDLQDAQEFDIT